MPTTIYHPRRNSLALRILRHMQLHRSNFSSSATKRWRKYRFFYNIQ